MVSNRYTTLHRCQFQLKLETHLRRNNVEKRRSPRLENSTLLKSEVRVVSWLIQISIHKICYFKNPGPTAHRPLLETIQTGVASNPYKLFRAFDGIPDLERRTFGLNPAPGQTQSWSLPNTTRFSDWFPGCRRCACPRNTDQNHEMLNTLHVHVSQSHVSRRAGWQSGLDWLLPITDPQACNCNP